MNMPPRIVPEAQVDEQLDQAIRVGLCACFPHSRETFSRTRAWRGSAPTWSVILEEGERIIAYVGVHQPTICVGEQPVNVAGVQNVFVLPEYRGQRLSCPLLEMARTILAHTLTHRNRLTYA